eukprot:448094_1
MSTWFSVSECPCRYISSALQINRSEFVVVPSTTVSLLSNTHGDGIYKYNVKQDQWIKFFEYEQGFVSTFVSAAFDEGSKLIYICNSEHELLEFNLITMSMKLLMKSMVIRGFINMICVNGIVHLIGANLNTVNKHYIYDKNSNLLNETNELGVEPIGHFMYLKSKRTITLFDRVKSEIHEFQLWDNKCIKYKCESIPFLRVASIVATKNEQYFIVLGGFKGFAELSKCIFLFDVKNKAFLQSSLECPEAGSYNATIMRDDIMDELMVFGYVNQCFATDEFVSVQKLPFYLIKLINRWICNEWIYLVQYISGKHWKIHVDSIIQSVQ